MHLQITFSWFQFVLLHSLCSSWTNNAIILEVTPVCGEMHSSLQCREGAKTHSGLIFIALFQILL